MTSSPINELTVDQLVPRQIIENLSPENWESLKADLTALILEQRLDVFEQEGGAQNKWEETKNHYDDDHKTLQDTGVLRNSFTANEGEGAEHKEIINEGDDVGVKTHVEYAAIHNYGGEIKHPGTDNGFGKGIIIPAHTINIPPRPFDQFSDENLAEIAEVIEGYLNE